MREGVDLKRKNKMHQTNLISDGGVDKGVYLIRRQQMKKKLLISQSIMWAAAILVVSIVDEKQFTISLLVILATVSLMNLRKIK